jgi:ATP-dependent RNA helicase DDX49/DBP8
LDLTGMKTPHPSRSPTVSRHDWDTASISEHLQRRREHESADEDEHDDERDDDATLQLSSRKGTGGLRVANSQLINEDLSEHQRQMQVEARTFPKRRKVASEKFVFQPSTLDKLIIGIWEQVSGHRRLPASGRTYA